MLQFDFEKLSDQPLRGEHPATPSPREPKRDIWAMGYLCAALPLALFYVFYMPAFQVADEHNHLARAEHLLRGQLRAQNHEHQSGGALDTGATAMACLFGAEAAPRATVERAWKIPWSQQFAFRDFSNTVRYPPPFYLPQMAGLAVGKLLHLPVLAGLYLARLFNAMCVIGAAYFAIRFTTRGKALLAFVLLLPMATHEAGSAAQDAGLILGGVVLAAALVWREPMSRGAYWGLAALIAAMAASRPPLAPLAALLVLPGFGPTMGWKLRAATVLGVVAATLGWFAVMQQVTGSMTLTNVDPAAQARVVLSNPWQFLRMAAGSLSSQHLRMEAVGVLGWLNIPLDPWAQKLARLGFGCVCLSVALQPARLPMASRATILLCAAGCLLLMTLATYLTWNPVGHEVIYGMQGRYLLPLLPLLAPAMPHLSWIPQRFIPRLQACLLSTAAACSLVTAGFGIWAVARTHSLLDSFPFLNG